MLWLTAFCPNKKVCFPAHWIYHAVLDAVSVWQAFIKAFFDAIVAVYILIAITMPYCFADGKCRMESSLIVKTAELRVPIPLDFLHDTLYHELPCLLQVAIQTA